jgi:uncharacterized membrane protein YcaP (DUF421 family)
VDFADEIVYSDPGTDQIFRVMEQYTLQSIFNLILLMSTIGLFVFIKWHFSTLSSNVKNRLQTHEIILTMVVGFIVFFVISSKAVPIVDRYVFFVTIVGIHVGTCLLMLKAVLPKEKLFGKSYLIFQNGQFFKGIMVQHKLSEGDIRATLKIKGVSDLRIVESIILERDGELTVIYKENYKNAA